MNTIMIESIDKNGTEIRTELTKDEGRMILLMRIGLNVRKLLANSTAEFLAPDATQYRVSMLAPGTFVNGAWDTTVPGMIGGDA